MVSKFHWDKTIASLRRKIEQAIPPHKGPSTRSVALHQVRKLIDTTRHKPTGRSVKEYQSTLTRGIANLVPFAPLDIPARRYCCELVIGTLCPAALRP